MPQMMPMKWFLIFLMFTLLLILTFNLLYYLLLFNKIFIYKNFCNQNKWFWKWL